MKTATIDSKPLHWNKGRVSWNSGKSWSEDVKKKISENRVGKGLGHKFNVGRGHPQSEETKKKISNANKGKKKPPFTKEHRDKISKANLGRKYGLNFRLKISERTRGENNPMWKGGIYPENRAFRDRLEYKLWREAVFERDDYTCQSCWARSGIGNHVELHAHHLKPFAIFPELRVSIDNGITLCVSCHRKTETWGKKL